MQKFCKKISFAEGKQRMEQEPDCLILDVREEEEYWTGHAVNAVSFPLNTIDAESAAKIIPSKDTPLLVYCKSGRRSEMASEILKNFGYTAIYDMGGLVGWPYGLTYD